MSGQKQKSQIDLLKSASLVATNNVALERLSIGRPVSPVSRCCSLIRWESIEITTGKPEMESEGARSDAHEIQRIGR